MDDWLALNAERSRLEYDLLDAEQAIEQQRGRARPDPEQIGLLQQRIDAALERLRAVNELLAQQARPPVVPAPHQGPAPPAR
jgi:hypothetical protein